MKIELAMILKDIDHEVLKDLPVGDLERVAYKAARSFSGRLSKDEIETCILSAFWKSLERYKKDKNCKFTTYFYKGVLMECLTQNKFNFNKTSSRSIHDNIPHSNNRGIDTIDMLDNINTYCDDPSIIYDRFYKNMSINEIATNLGVCNETIRIKIKKNLNKLKQNFSKLSV